MNLIISLLFAAVTLFTWFMPVPAQAALLFYDGFESGTIDWDDQPCQGVAGSNPNGKYTCHDGNPPGPSRAVENNVPARAGQYYLRSTVGTDMQAAWRSEVTSPSNARLAEKNWNGKEFWIGFSVYFPSSEYAFRNSGGGVPWDRDMIYQWHANLDSLTAQEFCGDCYPLIIATMPEPGLGRKQSGNLIWRIETNYGDYNLSGVVEHDKWYDWVIHVKWTYDDNGIMEIWKDGVLVHSYYGKNMPHDTLGPYWKIGDYKAWWRDDIHPEDADEPRRSVYHDEYRIGDANSSYAEVAPAGGAPAPSGGGGGFCNSYTNTTTTPAGYGVAYNIFSTAKELILNVLCGGTNTQVTFSAGNGQPTTYVWHQAYYTKNARDWVPINLTGATTAGGGLWIIGKGERIESMTTAEQQTQNFFAAYVCVLYQNSSWKCGCQDNVCAVSSWNLQGFRK